MVQEGRAFAARRCSRQAERKPTLRRRKLRSPVIAKNATGVVVTDTLPGDIGTTVTATTSVAGVNATVAGSQVTASFGEIDAGDSVTLTITVVPTLAAAADSPLVDSAKVTNNEFNSSPNTASVATTILPIVAVAITQLTATPGPVVYGSDLTYKAVVTNNGPSKATGVVVTMPLPAFTKFVSGSWKWQSGAPASNGGVSLDDNTITAEIGELDSGATAVVTAVVTPGQDAVGSLTASMGISENEFDSTASAATAMVTTTVQDQPGDLQFTSPFYAVDNNAGYATITILRTSGLGGEVSAMFTTFSLTAAAGSDYTPVSQTVDFPAGVARQTVRVPVLDNPYDSQDETVGLKLTSPTGGALLGAPTTSVLTIQVLNPNENHPTVAAVQWTGTAQSITSLVISFSEPLIAAAAVNPANYQVAGVGKKGSFSTAIGQNVTLEAPMYNASNWTVTLVPTQSLSVNQFYSLLIKGTPGGITDLGGNELAGAGTGHPGTNFTALFAQGKNLKYTDAGGNQVSFSVTKGGYLEDLLTGSGQGQRLVLVGALPHHTVLTGSVKQGKHGTGRAYLGYSLYGLGQFGNVKVTLKSPPFQLQRFPFSPGLPLGPPTPALARLSGSPIEAGGLARAAAAVRGTKRAPAGDDDLRKLAEPAMLVQFGLRHPSSRPFAMRS